MRIRAVVRLRAAGPMARGSLLDSPVSRARLRVMTYNIRNGRGRDDRVDLDRIAGVIAAYAPDVVALQEVDAGRARSGGVDQTAYLADQLAMSAAFAVTIDDGAGERYGLATLTRLPLLGSRQIALPAQPIRRRSEPRCALVTRLCWPGPGHELDVVNTHLSVLAGERPAQIAALATCLAADEVIVVGDFNCTPWSGAFRTLARALVPVTRRVRSWPARLPLVPIDHILYRGPLHVVRAGAWTAGAARDASDHLPVVAELERVPLEAAA